ncbi:hypothetical protein [Amycolatopsis taiwanensis]|uniref:hypothetical protein n=1 Tax=Amycolatopsis taiwanensis TaxID=342230 RepID=UPI000487F7BA|nr:hypothetical protein [Amycolatopsis taiwanensis]
MTVHERDCAPCDAARQAVAELRTQFDPLDNWDEVEVQGKTTTEFATELIASALHRFPLDARPRPGATR